ncbi:MAG: glycosyl hydrolase family 95 catalytic domain-containing protein [Phocaeicola sp.]
MKLKLLLLLALSISLGSCEEKKYDFEASFYDLEFPYLAESWDEAMPLGNGMVGALVWQKEQKLRISLDYVDLWDERPMVNYDSIPVRNFKWVEQQVRKKEYLPVQMMYDIPYDTSAFPTKIPGAALEFDTHSLGAVERVRLYLNNAVNKVTWKNKAEMVSFVHPTENIGWFKFDGVSDHFVPVLTPPMYDKSTGIGDDPVGGHDLRRLGYKQGEVTTTEKSISYTQQGFGDFTYQVVVKYKKSTTGIEGVWSISTNRDETNAETLATEAMKRGYHRDLAVHQNWWSNYWSQSSISVPDTVLAKQYYNELYKFGSAARSYSPPISLQAVWTADNGKLPPWKGDYHHDLNTQLSYWHAYTANKLEESMGYLNWLWKVKETNKKYTKDYFGTDGLAVPGVTTLSGEPMAGWIQYSFSPTVSAWLAQHFYLQWQFSQDEQFLREKAYPYMQEVLVLFDQLCERDAKGKRTLPISASPEIYDNSLKAWFLNLTNYDLALVRFAYTAAIDMAKAQGLDADVASYTGVLSEWPLYDLDSDYSLTFAKGCPYEESHRHFSNVMAIHPLGLIDVSQGEESEKIVKATIKRLDDIGPSQWTGYSYSWLGNLKARALDGEGAAEALRIFAQHFCLRNTFHANGDQTAQGYSSFTYSPFTLEGNFAFAAGLQEMLIQSHTGVVSIFPALPSSWKDVSFDKLRTVGAFVVSAKMKAGELVQLTVTSEKGGLLRLKKPTEEFLLTNSRMTLDADGTISIKMNKGETIELI